MVKTASGNSISPSAHDGVEGRLHVSRRVADDLENFRRRGLLLQRFCEIISALAQLVEQSRVLDGNDGLGSEVLHQLDLLIGERPYFGAIDKEGADQLVLLKHRHRDRRSRASVSDRKGSALAQSPDQQRGSLFLTDKGGQTADQAWPANEPCRFRKSAKAGGTSSDADRME